MRLFYEDAVDFKTSIPLFLYQIKYKANPKFYTNKKKYVSTQFVLVKRLCQANIFK